MAIIGFDFGNYNSFPCFISDFDPDTRMGGIVHDLLPAGLNDGIPSVFYYSPKVGTLCGEEAVRARAKPLSNRLRYLKRHLGETTTLDGTTISYDDAITAVIQHCIRRANKQLQDGWQITTNLISISYPATFTFAQLQRLIELAEKATLEDGTPVKVHGTIAEPAAAALDFLAGTDNPLRDTTVLTYDLGGGTFDLALVSVYPGGRKNASGGTYYYDILNTRGLAKLGGVDFDDVMYKLLESKLDVPLKKSHKDALRSLAESTKIELSTDTYSAPDLFYDDDFISMEVTQEEFEKAAYPLLMQTVNATKSFLAEHPNQRPAVILLTGGGSQMPMVRKALEAALPEYKDRIVYFRPSKAIAYGAARFGTVETNTDPSAQQSIIQRRVMYDLGVRFFHNSNDTEGYISTYIPAGTPIPYSTNYKLSYTLYDGQRYVSFRVYESKGSNPDTKKVKQDYTEIMAVELDHGKSCPKGTKSETRLVVDNRGLLVIEARDPNQPGNPPMKNSVTLQNLS